MHYFILVICMWASLSTILATPAICLPCSITIIINVTTTMHSNIFCFTQIYFGSFKIFLGSVIRYFFGSSKYFFQSDLLRGVHVALAVPQVAPPVPATIGVPLPEVVVDLTHITHHLALSCVNLSRDTCHALPEETKGRCCYPPLEAGSLTSECTRPPASPGPDTTTIIITTISSNLTMPQPWKWTWR